MDLRGASLDDLQVFLAVVKAGGFRDAARRLGISASTVSERLQRLEGRLGVRLLIRTTRSVTPTRAGRLLADRLAPALAEASHAIQEAMDTGEGVRGTLTLNVPGAVMIDILPPLIFAFLARHPEVRVEIVVEDRFVDAFAAGADAGIRYGERLAQDMISVPIGPAAQEIALGASPALLDAYGHPEAPEDLMGLPWIRARFASGRLIPIELERDGKVVTLEPEPRLILSAGEAHVAVAAAAAGLGCVCLFRNWLDPHFESGALIPLLPSWWSAFDGPRLYFPSRRLLTAPLRAFVDFLAEARERGGAAG